jgi:hypothetical protein
MLLLGDYRQDPESGIFVAATEVSKAKLKAVFEPIMAEQKVSRAALMDTTAALPPRYHRKAARGMADSTQEPEEDKPKGLIWN